jgi:Rrf2 family protein
MVDLALHSEGGPVRRVDIAARQEVSTHYIEQLFVKLRKAGLIRSVRGPGGGYLLAQGPADVTVGDIIRVVEGPIALVHCVGHEPDSSCPRADACVTHLLWRRLSDRVAAVLDAATLQDLCDEARELQGLTDPNPCNTLKTRKADKDTQ